MMDSIKGFFAEYGWGFLMLVCSGLLTAGLIEVIVKNPVKWLEGKWQGHDRLIAVLLGFKAVVTQVVAWTLSVWFAQLVCKVVALPGGEVLLPLWVALAYLAQYVFSCFGIKGIIDYAKKRAEREPEKKEKKEKPVLTRTEYKGVFRNAAGELVDKHGNPVKF